MDIAYLREHPETIDRLVEHQRIRTGRITGGATSIAERWTLDDGTDLFAKSHPGTPSDFFVAQARGLAWLAETHTVPTPQIIGVTETYLVTEWIPAGKPSTRAARALGRELAQLHQHGAEAFGAPWNGYIGPLPLDNRASTHWPEFFVERRLRPYLRAARDAQLLDHDQASVFERVFERIDVLAGPSEPPARTHGDLWSGNIHYGADGKARLIDPAAHGGHRETDLANLALFAAPHLADILDAYQETWPLSDGWRDRIGLHQLHLLLVHVVVFGASYTGRAVSTARELG